MISVAIQGGAMRSVYCAGAVRALIELGYAGQVATLHTASAGCVAGVVLAACATNPDGPTPVDIREQLISQIDGTQFINLRRIHTIVDVDHLVEALRDVTGISAKRLASRDLVFEVGMTDARTGAPRYIDLKECEDDVDVGRALRATMALPALYPRRIAIDGRRYVDGGISDPLPMLRALRRNPTVIVAISSVARAHLGWELEGIEPLLVRLIPGVLASHLKHLLLTRNPLAAAVEELTELPSFLGVRVVRIAPADQSVLIHRLETHRDKLLWLEEMGYRDGLQALAHLSVPRSPPSLAAPPSAAI